MVFRILDNDRFRLYCWLHCVVTVLCVACLLSWLSLTPRNPRFQISFESSSMNQSTDKHLLFNLRISNPNKRMGIFYSGITLNLYEGCCRVIGTNSTPPFYQGYKNTTSLDILIHATTQQGSSDGNIDHIVGVHTDVRFRIMRWKTKLRQIEYKSVFRMAPEYEAGEAQAPTPAGFGIKASENLTF
ncbi:hypothetical protein F511_12772 [Dorcoceras hygrometricum]|uniref:Late embryogenesis abundant protein LEA-2 subgroup domain-containing protein n=1 Tax=Dorcoceras hygrometricum TaxID=472368 RepID=A0A2Z7D6Y1_9LAMI|nr:hypothetical protein F511_12772 [Dorcoceras hygrometricum]